MKTAAALPTAAEPTLRPISLRFPIPLTDTEMLKLSTLNEGLQFEQSSDGILFVTPPTGGRGNLGEGRLFAQIDAWNEKVQFGVVFGPTGGIRLPKGGQYEADAAPISRSAWDAVPVERRDDGFVPVLPTAVFELLSPANLTANGYAKEFSTKLEDYKRSEVPLVVLLHPKTESATIRRPGHEDENSTETILIFPELPGLELDAGAIYAAVNRPERSEVASA